MCHLFKRQRDGLTHTHTHTHTHTRLPHTYTHKHIPTGGHSALIFKVVRQKGPPCAKHCITCYGFEVCPPAASRLGTRYQSSILALDSHRGKKQKHTLTQRVSLSMTSNLHASLCIIREPASEMEINRRTERERAREGEIVPDEVRTRG